jgi:hypothetical protein
MNATPSYGVILPAPTSPSCTHKTERSRSGRRRHTVCQRRSASLHGAARRGDDDLPQPRRDEAPSNSLDNFEPAFRRLLGEHPVTL